jgi:hypothetical protein
VSIQPGANLYTQGFGSRPESVEVPFVTNRAPLTTDINYPIGKRWIWQGIAEYVLLSFAPIMGGGVTANWVETAGNNLYPVTPFVVGPKGQAGYQTIQSAVNAAQLAGGGIVYIQPGTYVENITMTTGVDLVAWIGSSGNIGYTITGTETLPVTIQGNFTLNLTAALVTPTIQFKDIAFTCTSGVLFSYTGNLALLESGYITFDNCQMIASSGTTFIFSNDGFFNINFNSSEVTETTPGSSNFITFGATPFLNLNIRDSYIRINRTSALVIPTGAFNVFTMQSTYWAALLDVSAGTQSLTFIAVDSVLDGNSSVSGTPLINFGANSGSLFATNCSIPTANGSLANSTDVSAAAVFRFHYCIWNNPLVLGATGRGEFSFCEFYGGTSPAFTMGSSENVSILSSVVNSTNNPAITGAGAGTLTLSDITFTGNSNIAGTLTITVK